MCSPCSPESPLLAKRPPPPEEASETRWEEVLLCRRAPRLVRAGRQGAMDPGAPVPGLSSSSVPEKN